MGRRVKHLAAARVEPDRELRRADSGAYGAPERLRVVRALQRVVPQVPEAAPQLFAAREKRLSRDGEEPRRGREVGAKRVGGCVNLEGYSRQRLRDRVVKLCR